MEQEGDTKAAEADTDVVDADVEIKDVTHTPVVEDHQQPSHSKETQPI
jgi:hypothetical protein